MKTGWDVIRKAINSTIGACEKLDAVDISSEGKRNPDIRWGNYEDGVSVGDFLYRFKSYPEGAARGHCAPPFQLNAG